MKTLKVFVRLQFFSLIYLQKLALPLPGIPPVSAPLIILVAGLVFIASRSPLSISYGRLSLFLVFCILSIVPHIFIYTPYSLASILMLLTLYAPLTVTWQLSSHAYLDCQRSFQNMMILPAALVFLQLATQVVFGSGHSPSLEILVPHAFLLPGYAYQAPMQWGSEFVRPNGFFMLEPSFISDFLAAALIVELTQFRRATRIIIYLSALLATLGGTGLVMLAIAAPFMFVRQTSRVRMLGLIYLALGLVVLGALGFVGTVFSRAEEFSSPTSSGFARVILPSLQLYALMSDPGHLVIGSGAGNVDDTVASSWPVVKMYSEYGLLATLAFLIFLLGSVMRGSDKPLMVALVLIFMFTGGYLLSPTLVEELMLFCSFLIVDPQSREQAERLSLITPDPNGSLWRDVTCTADDRVLPSGSLPQRPICQT